MAHCIQCNRVEIVEEYTRCTSCETEHKRLCAELDAKPKQYEAKVKEKLFPVKKIMQGVEVTTWISREDAALFKIKLP
ncbi:MAG: hypothetical protein AABY22_11175 [Nanoarchaeota archaeon]